MKTSDPIRCKTCDQGQLVKTKKYRMSGVVVFIGYVLLVPSVVGMLIGAIMLFTTASGTGSTVASIKSEAQTKLKTAGVSPAVTAKVLDSKRLSNADRTSLTASQRQTVEDVQTEMTAGTAGAGIGATIAGGFSVFVLISSLVGGLLGWLLVMKKKVLQCTHCGAVVAAS